MDVVLTYIVGTAFVGVVLLLVVSVAHSFARRIRGL